MFRQLLIRLGRVNLFVVLLAGIALGAALAPSPAATQYAEGTEACEFGEMYHLPIVPGDLGDEVSHAQCLLNEHWGYQLTVDGAYGPETRDAIEEVQRIWELPDNGIVNPCTWYALHDDTQGSQANC